MSVKSIIIREEDIDERVVYSIYFKCPYCNYGNDLEWEFRRPTKCKCFRCEKTIRFKNESTINK